MATIIRGPLIAPIPARGRFIADVPLNLLLTTLAVAAAVSPFNPPDLPVVQNRQRYVVDYPPNLQTSVFYVVPPAPFNPIDLFTPRTPSRFVADIPPNLLTNILVTAASPFTPSDLPTPRAPSRFDADIAPNITGALLPPFVPPDLPTPRPIYRFNPGVDPNVTIAIPLPFISPDTWTTRTQLRYVAEPPVNLLTSLLYVVPPAPFALPSFSEPRPIPRAEIVFYPPNLLATTLKPTTVAPTIFLTNNAQRNVGGTGAAQRNAGTTANTQRNLGLTGDAEVNA